MVGSMSAELVIIAPKGGRSQRLGRALRRSQAPLLGSVQRDLSVRHERLAMGAARVAVTERRTNA